MRLKSKERIINAAVALASIALVMATLEGGTRILDAVSPMPARSWTEYRLRIPPPYQGAAYEVPELIEEAKAVTWRTGPDFGWLPEDRSGRYINIEGGRRKTTGSGAEHPHHIWMFGGSTMMGAEVPDDMTIPSALQRHVDEGNGGFTVENLGSTTITSMHQLFKLRTMTPVKAGDVVVFYDGVNDVIQSLYYQAPGGTMAAADRRTIDNIPRPVRWVYSALDGRSSFVHRFLSPISPAAVTMQVTDEEIVALEESYLSTIREADAFTRARGATFLHFLQPNLYTVSRPSPYEQSVLENGWLYPIGLKQVYAVGYPALRRAMHRAAAAGIRSVDISDAFDRRTREIFLDFCHVTEQGNELAAAAIFGFPAPAPQSPPLANK